MAVEPSRRRKDRPPLDRAGLEQAALSYAGRYATTRARLAAYLQRKLRERGWAGPGAPAVEELVGRMAELGYVDDRAFATARAASLGRRGYGARRVAEALRAAGIEEEDGASAFEAARLGAWQAALRFAERRRLGPYAVSAPDRKGEERAIAAFLRAGHSAEIARRLARARPGQVPDADDP